jgi:hypothetical protein
MKIDYNSPYEIKENKDGTFTLYFLVGEEMVALKTVTEEGLEELVSKIKEVIAKVKS